MPGSLWPLRLMSWIQNWSCVCTCTSQEPSALKRTSTTSGQVQTLPGKGCPAPDTLMSMPVQLHIHELPQFAPHNIYHVVIAPWKICARVCTSCAGREGSTLNPHSRLFKIVFLKEGIRCWHEEYGPVLGVWILDVLTHLLDAHLYGGCSRSKPVTQESELAGSTIVAVWL